MRAHVAEAMQGIEYRSHEGNQNAMGMVYFTDCKSLYDLVNKRATAPSERCLLLNIATLRNDIEEERNL